MNLQAANGLLEVLEEPPADVVFILVTHARDKLLPTIKSRCRQNALKPARPRRSTAISAHTRHGRCRSAAGFSRRRTLFEPAPEQDALRRELLELLAAPRLLGILDYAAAFDKQKWPLAVFLDWLHKWLLDIGLSARQMPPLYYPAHASALHKVASKPMPPHFLPCLAAYLH